MNDKQKQCFEMVYNHVHDERSANGNLITFIDICFPDPEENDVSRALHTAVKLYLQAREKMGTQVMDLLYTLQEDMKDETG